MSDVQLPKGVSQETYEEVKAAITRGFGVGDSPDNIKTALFDFGVSFANLNKLYRMITKSEGLIIDPKVVNEAITAAMPEIAVLKDATYEQLTASADNLASEIKGATSGKVLSKIKIFFNENEVEFPRKPAPSRGRMGRVSKVLINLFKDPEDSGKAVTEAMCVEALLPVCKTPEIAATKAKQLFKVLYAVKNNLSANEVLTQFSTDNK